jgi:hypothetical protein
MIRVSVVGVRVLRVDGIERGDGITVSVLRDILRNEQRRLAELFDRAQQTARGPLRWNSPRYTRWKRRRGFSPKRGQKTGFLLRVLRSRILWRVRIARPPGKPGTAWLSFSENELIGIVPYYRWYRDGNQWHDGKTARDAGILIMTKRFATALRDSLQRLQDQAAAAREGRRRLREQLEDAEERGRFSA